MNGCIYEQTDEQTDPLKIADLFDRLLLCACEPASFEIVAIEPEGRRDKFPQNGVFLIKFRGEDVVNQDYVTSEHFTLEATGKLRQRSGGRKSKSSGGSAVQESKTTQSSTESTDKDKKATEQTRKSTINSSSTRVPTFVRIYDVIDDIDDPNLPTGIVETTIAISPRKLLRPKYRYELVISEDVEDLQGNYLLRGEKIRLATKGGKQYSTYVNKITPNEDDADSEGYVPVSERGMIWVEFSGPADPDNLIAKVIQIDSDSKKSHDVDIYMKDKPDPANLTTRFTSYGIRARGLVAGSLYKFSLYDKSSNRLAEYNMRVVQGMRYDQSRFVGPSEDLINIKSGEVVSIASQVSEDEDDSMVKRTTRRERLDDFVREEVSSKRYNSKEIP